MRLINYITSKLCSFVWLLSLVLCEKIRANAEESKFRFLFFYLSFFFILLSLLFLCMLHLFLCPCSCLQGQTCFHIFSFDYFLLWLFLFHNKVWIVLWVSWVITVHVKYCSWCRVYMAGVIMVITCQNYCAQLKSAEIQK